MRGGPPALRNRGPLWESLRVFLVPDDVLYMRTTAAKWNIAGLYGPFAELFFFLLKKDGKKRHHDSSREAERAIRPSAVVRVRLVTLDV